MILPFASCVEMRFSLWLLTPRVLILAVSMVDQALRFPEGCLYLSYIQSMPTLIGKDSETVEGTPTTCNHSWRRQDNQRRLKVFVLVCAIRLIL